MNRKEKKMQDNTVKDSPLNGAVFYIRGVPDDVKLDFKVLCAQKKQTMTQVLIDLIRKAINGEVKL